MTPPPIPLSSCCRADAMGAGARGLVTSVEGEDAVVERLASLGVVPGTRLKVLRAGSPMAMAVGDTRIAMGRDWAEALVVLPV